MGKEIIDYHITYAWMDITSNVQHMMKDGWEPLGGVSIALAKNDDGETVIHYAQALVKYAYSGD